MMAQDGARELDTGVFERYIRHIMAQNEVSFRHQSAGKPLQRSNQHVASEAFDDKTTEHVVRSESYLHSPKHSFERNRPHSFKTEASSAHDSKGQESSDHSGLKHIPNSDAEAPDKPSLSPKRAGDRNTTDGECETGGIRAGEDKSFDFIGNKGKHGGGKDRKSAGWSVISAEAKHETISRSDEEEMLHLSQSSTPEKSKMGEPGARVKLLSPKRRKRQKNRVVKRPRPFTSRRLSNHIEDILSGKLTSPEELHGQQQQHSRDSKQVRPRSPSPVLGDLGHGEPPVPEQTNLESVQNGEISLAHQDSADDHHRLNGDARKKMTSEMSAKPLMDAIITGPRLGAPGSKRSKGEEKQSNGSDGGDRDAAAPSAYLKSSSDSAISQETERGKRRKPAFRIREDTDGDENLQIFQEQRYGDAQESNGLKHEAELDELAKSEDDAAILSGSVKRKETAEAGIEESPRRHRKKPKSKRRPRSVAKEASSSEPISSREGGYIISKGGQQAALQLRTKLLRLQLDKGDNLAISHGPAVRNDSSSDPGESPPDGTSMPPESILDDSKDARRERTVENSPSKAKNGQPSLHGIATEDPDESFKPTGNSDFKRYLQEVKGILPRSEMIQGTEKKVRSSTKAGEKTLGSPSDGRANIVDRRKGRKVRREPSKARGKLSRQYLATAQGSNMAEFSEASLVRTPQNREAENVSVTGNHLNDLKGRGDAEAHDVSGSIDGPGPMLNRPRPASTPRKKPEENVKMICDENSPTGRTVAHKELTNLSSTRKHHEFGQIEGGDSFPTLFGSGQGDMMEATTKTLHIRSPAQDEGEKTLKELSSKEGCLPHIDAATLEGTQSSRHDEPEQKDRQCRESRSTQPEHISMEDEKLGVAGSSPGDMSHRNRSRTFKRKQHDNQDIIPLLVKPRPSREQGNVSKLKNKPKASQTPSSVVEDEHKGHSARRSAMESHPMDMSENGPGRPVITQLGDEDAVGEDSASVVKKGRLPKSFEDSNEAEDIPDHDSVSNHTAEVIEESSLQEGSRKASRSPYALLPNDLEDGPALEKVPGGGSKLQTTRGEKHANETEDLDSESVEVAKTSVEQRLDDLLDPNKLKKQSELLTRRSKRSKRNSRSGGARSGKSIKALDELSDNEDSKDKAWPATLSGTSHRSKAKRLPNVEPQKTHPMKTRGRGGTCTRASPKSAAVIDLTDLADDDTAVADTRATDDDDEIAESLKELQKLSLEDKTKHIFERPRCKFLTPLSDDESKLATDLTTRTKRDTKIVAIAEAGITLHGESFKRLRGTRWLDDEVLNAYVSLINSRNDAIFSEMDEERRAGIPRTYVFNTYFFTRLCSGSSGFDYPGVEGWTKRAEVDILKRDIILIPINLGNHHWVLSCVDIEHKEVLYLDSMHGPDTAGALSILKRWVFEELLHKHGEDMALELDPHSWKQVKNYYRIRRVGVLPARIEPRDSVAGRMSKVPKQQDSGSCGVFTAKIADCLSLGTKVYFNQKHIRLIRQRMALDLFNGYVPL